MLLRGFCLQDLWGQQVKEHQPVVIHPQPGVIHKTSNYSIQGALSLESYAHQNCVTLAFRGSHHHPQKTMVYLKSVKLTPSNVSPNETIFVILDPVFLVNDNSHSLLFLAHNILFLSLPSHPSFETTLDYPLFLYLSHFLALKNTSVHNLRG